MHRILLQNLHKTPNREELTTSERTIGDMFLAPLDLKYGGFHLYPETGKKCATWMVPHEKLNAAIDFVESKALDGYEAILLVDIEDAKGHWVSRRFA